MTCSDLLSGHTLNRRKNKLSCLLISGVVWEQQKKKSCQTRCKVVGAVQRGWDCREDWEEERSFAVCTKFWCFRSLTCLKYSLSVYFFQTVVLGFKWETLLQIQQPHSSDIFMSLDCGFWCLKSCCLHSWRQIMLLQGPERDSDLVHAKREDITHCYYEAEAFFGKECRDYDLFHSPESEGRKWSKDDRITE